MALQGSTAWRGVVELSKTLDSTYRSHIPERLFLYADGGGDRRITFLQVQKGLIALFLHHDFDEIIAAQPAAYQSYRNPVERCHAIANLGLQGVGMMRAEMPAEMERIMKKCNGNEDVRKECEKSPEFREAYKISMGMPRKLLEYVMGKLSLKDEQFKIQPPADEDEINYFIESELSKIDHNLVDLSSHDDIAKNPRIKRFYEIHVIKRTYFFLVRKGNDSCSNFHNELRGSEEVTEFPDPEPYEIEGVQHYRPGKDPSERYLPSKLEDAEKRPHNVPFTPSAQTAKNVGITVKCVECERPRLLYSKHKA